MESAPDVLSVSFREESNQLSDGGIMVGFLTRQVLVHVQEEVEPSVVRKFYSGVQAFFVAAASYIVEKFPWNDELIQHASFADLKKRELCSFDSVQYFLSRFPQHLPADAADDVYDEFCIYQTLPATPADLQVEFAQSDTLQPDILWHGLEKLKI